MFSGNLSAAQLDKLSYRSPMRVTHIRCHRNAFGLTGFPVCPRCELTMDREYQAYCDRCGQCLSWKGFVKAALILPEKEL